MKHCDPAFSSVMLNGFVSIVFVICLNFSILAQNQSDFGFERTSTIPVSDLDNKLLDLAWVGGLNACQFHAFDLNFNGVNDLIIFDRHGNQLLTLLNNGGQNEYAYSFAPEYIRYFPKLEHWVQFHDFNNDGKKDIFTYTVGGIKVYKNISDTLIRFEQVTHPYLRSKYGTIETNLLVTNVDYPAILDFDGDGDLDIFTFWGLGSFLEKHSNQSQELYGNSDSLIYKKTDYCWGYFAESDESNAITLDTCLDIKHLIKGSNLLNNDERHTGSTLLMLDMTGNGLKDLILGDIDFPGLYLLKNEGTADSARIVSVDTLFPSNTRSVKLFSFPAVSLAEINNDGINDLIVSPFDPSLRRSRHHNSVWFYKNTGSNKAPAFTFEREDLFQHRMIDVGAGAMPVLTDVDGDGLPDLIIGNYGFNDTCWYDQFSILRCKYSARLSYFKNTGTTGNPAFRLVNDNFAGISSLGLRATLPTFGDIDGDGKKEMIVGNESGNLLLFKDQSPTPGEVDYQLVDDNFQQVKVGAFSAPQLIDLRGNGLLDLVLGQENGKLSYYQNQGSATEPVFIKTTENLGNVNVTDPNLSYTGRSIPHFFRDKQNSLRLFVGSESGRIFYYKDIEANLNGTFTLAEERLAGISEGIMTAPATAYLPGNDYPNLIVGNYRGGVSYYKGIVPAPYGIANPDPGGNSEIKVYPNPAADYATVVFAQSFISAELRLYDFTGRIVFNTIVRDSQEFVIPLKNLKNGLYLIHIMPEGETKVMSTKLVVSRR